jgi:hypothetical protein
MVQCNMWDMIQQTRGLTHRIPRKNFNPKEFKTLYGSLMGRHVPVQDFFQKLQLLILDSASAIISPVLGGAHTQGEGRARCGLPKLLLSMVISLVIKF